jgi:hypothetical protein
LGERLDRLLLVSPLVQRLYPLALPGLRHLAPLETPRKGRRQFLVLRKRRTRLKNFSPFPLDALFPLALIGTNQGEPDTPDEPKGVHQ